ncbi:hypothetical protein AU192_04180 [Mycobacterium lehmannii]|uniref:Uncharacterized protein n=1 Tax=Mycobacterium lehmannii TaxID=2048550 RepID=A0A101A4S2_9MYCO|nr:hypothetical protein [Mycobacterium lehmannii]KUI13607.1 hypothetical protein AU192_04180 [Mycobacterium lehmannii]
MTTEAHQIAARLAAASEVFPIKKTDDFDSRADVTAEGDVITVVVTDHLGRAKREYRAVIQYVAEDARHPGAP